jgi:hypothetical protein
MIGPEDHAHAGFFGGVEHFRARAFGVIGILRVHVNDRAVIFINAEIGERDALAGETLARLVNRLQAFRQKPALNLFAQGFSASQWPVSHRERCEQ